jgi:hypothetical protein
MAHIAFGSSATVIAFCVLNSACQTVVTQTVPDGPRFAAPEEILVGVDSGVAVIASAGGRIASPRYPADERERSIEAHPIIAFVVDTTGRIESRTLTFLVAISPGFQESLCEWRKRIRMTPARVAGVARRTLIVQAFSFEIGSVTKRAPPDVEPFKKHLRTIGSDSAFALLEGMSHCRD